LISERFSIKLRLKNPKHGPVHIFQSGFDAKIAIRIRLKNFNQGAIQKLLTRVRLKCFVDIGLMH